MKLGLKGMWRLIMLASVLGISGCASVGIDIFGLQVPRRGYHKLPDVAYGALPEQKLDVYVPDGAWATGAGSRPVVLFLPGGRWASADKSLYRFVGQALASYGFITMVADFRQYPAVRFPVFVDDAATAAAFVHRHAAEYGGNPAALFLMGHSSGAHMAAMIALDSRYLAAEGLTPAIFRGVIGLAGPYDFLPLEEQDKDIFSPAARDLAQTQPITFVSPGAPPFLLLHGADDQTVLPRNSDHLAAKLRAEGDDVEEHVYPDTAHLGIILDLFPLLRGRAPVLSDITRFVISRSGLPPLSGN